MEQDYTDDWMRLNTQTGSRYEVTFSIITLWGGMSFFNFRLFARMGYLKKKIPLENHLGETSPTVVHSWI